jgi:hypothetical protein
LLFRAFPLARWERIFGIMYDMDTIDVKSAVAEIEATTDLLERALKLTGGTCGFACFDGNASGIVCV